ncbi:hypothetical protein BJX65DRAFT_298304 [Aspergillus insuetus]
MSAIGRSAFITLQFLSTVCHQTMGRFLPINVDRLLFIACRPTTRPLSTTERTVFDTQGCTVYGYPSTGGVLKKDAANLLDMVFLSLPRSYPSHRSPSADEEDRSCNPLRRAEEQIGIKEPTEEEEKVMVYGWPVIGSAGVWVLRFASAEQLPGDFGGISFAINMEEKI